MDLSQIKRNARKLSLIVSLLLFAPLIYTFRGDEELRTLLLFALYFTISLIYDLDSRYPIIASIILLASAAIFLPGNEALANKLAIYAYYFLVVGVTLQLIDFVRERRRSTD